MFFRELFLFFAERIWPSRLIFSESSRLRLASASASICCFSASVTVILNLPPLYTPLLTALAREIFTLLTFVRDTNYSRLVRTDRSVAIKLRRAQWASQRRERREAKERRVQCRELLFGKGRGKLKNLSGKDKAFVIAAKKEAWNDWLYRRGSGVLRTSYGHRKSTNPQHTPKYSAWQKVWYGGNKSAYVNFDVPQKMKKRLEALNGSTNSAVQELHGGERVQPEQRPTG